MLLHPPARLSPQGTGDRADEEGEGHVSTEEGAYVPLEVGFDLQGREVLLGPGASFWYEVGGLWLRLDADRDRGRRLEFIGEERWENAWASASAFVGVDDALDGSLPFGAGALDWSPPFLSDRQQVLRLGSRGAERVCRGELTVVCNHGCRGFREAGASFHGGDRVLLSGPGAILGGA